MQYQLLEDQLLLKLLKANDEEAFKEIYTRYWKPLFNAAYFRLNNKETAKELVQNVFLYLWEKRNSLTITHLQHYLQTAIKNRIVNHIEKTLVQKKYQQYISETSNQQSVETEATIQFNELYLAFEKAVQLLPQKTREVFKMSRLEHQSIKEIALHFNLSEKAVEYHITSSLKSLRLNLKEFMLSSVIVATLIQ